MALEICCQIVVLSVEVFEDINEDVNSLVGFYLVQIFVRITTHNMKFLESIARHWSNISLI